MNLDRREFLKLSAIAVAGVVAGCDVHPSVPKVKLTEVFGNNSQDNEEVGPLLSLDGMQIVYITRSTPQNGGESYVATLAIEGDLSSAEIVDAKCMFDVLQGWENGYFLGEYHAIGPDLEKWILPENTTFERLTVVVTESIDGKPIKLRPLDGSFRDLLLECS